jgi:hypothetical protein
MSLIKRRHQNSTGSPNEDEQSTDDELDDEENSFDGSDLSDADSNSDTESDGSDSDIDDTFGLKNTRPKIPTSNNNVSDNNLFKTLMGELDDGPDADIDPFHHDFSSAGLYTF